ncbi:MAG: type IV pilus modification PilV family protein, partial [Candidatus Methylumidiphilus sp.]
MVQPILTSNKVGFTLIELLVSLIITMVGLLGLLAAIDLAIATNMGNEMRLQATGIAE